MDALDHIQGVSSCNSHRLRLHEPLSDEWTSESMTGLLVLELMFRREVTDMQCPLKALVRSHTAAHSDLHISAGFVQLKEAHSPQAETVLSQ